jgi:hypothetical protein
MDPKVKERAGILHALFWNKMRLSLNDIKQSKCAPLNPHLFEEAVPAQKRSKFGNKKIVLDGYTFDSLKESRRFVELKMMQIIGEIHSLEVHPVFYLSVCKYEADFSFIREGKLIVEDVKSKITRRLSTYRLKKKLMLAEKGIEIIEI